MVLLTITPGIVRAITRAADLEPDSLAALQRPDEPVLADPKPGNSISHGQLIHLSKLLKQHGEPTTLEALLRSTSLYIPPPKPKPTQTPEYQALMARLRAEEEALSYQRMLHPPPTRETFAQRFPRAQEPFSIGSRPSFDASEDEEVTFEEVHRQMILIINVLVSIVCVAVFIWVAARHWTVGKRLGLSMGGSGAVAVAEVVVYGSYVRKVKEAKQREKKKPEIKKIVQSWVIDKDHVSDVASGKEQKGEDGVRYRKGKHR